MGYPHGRETPTCLVTQGALRTAHVGHLVSMVGKLAKFVGGPVDPFKKKNLLHFADFNQLNKFDL